MRNISDNELDKLFQDAAQRIEPEFDPGDWDKLSKRIDRSERIKIFKRIAIYFSLGLLLIFSTWIGVNYFQRQSDTKNKSVSNQAASVKEPGSGETVNGAKESEIDANATGIHGNNDDDNNGTPSGSSSDEATSSASMSDQQAGQTLSSDDQTKRSTENNIAGKKSEDIAATDERGSTTRMVDSSTIQDASKSKNIQKKSDLTAQNKTSSARIEDQNGNTPAERIPNDKRRIQEKSSQEDTSLPNENSTVQPAVNTISTDGIKDSNEEKANIASDKHRSSAISAVEEKQRFANVNNDTVTSVNTRADESKNSVTQNDNAILGTANQSNPSDQTEVNTLTPASRQQETREPGSTISSDSLSDAEAKLKNNAIVKDNNTNDGNASHKSGNAVRSTLNSLSTDTSVLKSEDNTASDTQGLAVESIKTEKTNGAALDKPEVNKSHLQEDSLQGPASVVKNAYNETKSVLANDTMLVDKSRATEKDSGTKITISGVENVRNQPLTPADHGVRSDSISGEADARKKSTDNTPAFSANDGTILPPVKNDEAVVKSSENNNAGIVKQTTSSATDASADSVKNQPKSTTAKRDGKSNTDVVKDSTLAKPVLQADTLGDAVSNQEAADNTREDEKKERQSNWYMKLLVSPDFSAIGYSKPGKTGFNIGLAVVYSPSEHWGFSTGAIWSKKLYDKNNPGKSYSYGGASFEADYLDGDCRVLDIPVNITYYIRPEARLNVYVTIGVSSYIMLKESYVYTVNENNQNYYYYEDYKNENHHWFSMLNLSFGLQYRISPRLQLQAEPFLKAPMSGVGQGKIDLVSAGSFFTLKYRFK
jgi:hypothetical protein